MLLFIKNTPPVLRLCRWGGIVITPVDAWPVALSLQQSLQINLGTNLTSRLESEPQHRFA